MHGKRTKNKILGMDAASSKWPTKTVNVNGTPTDVMSKLFLWKKGYGVQQTAEHKSVYNILNIDIEKDLKSQDYDGLDDVYLFLKRTDTQYNIEESEIAGYINQNIVLDTEERSIALRWSATSEESKLSTNEEIVQRIATNPYEFAFNIADDTDGLAAIALLDSAETAIERTVRVVSRKVEKYTSTMAGTTRYTLMVMLEMRYKRIAFVNTIDHSTLLGSVKTTIESFPDWNAVDPRSLISSITYTAFRNTLSHPINNGLYTMYIGIRPFTDTVLYTADGGVKYDALKSMKVTEFSKFLAGAVDSGYTETPASTWEKVVTVVVVIVIIIVAIYSGGVTAGLLTTGGTATGAAVTSAVVLSFAGTFALVVGIGGMVMGAVAGYFGRKNKFGLAHYIGKSVKFLGALSTIAGVVAIVTGISQAWNAAKEAATKAAQESARQAGTQAGQQAITEAAIQEIEATTLETLQEMLSQMFAESTKTVASTIQSVINKVSQGFQLWTKYIEDPKREEEINEKEAIIAAQEKELENAASPEMIDKVNRYFDDPYYNQYDTMTAMPIADIVYHMTQGKIDKSYQKYYDGI